MNSEERAIALRSITTNPVFRDTLDEMERDAFAEFMRIPAWRRFGPKGRSLIRHIDALRNVRERLDWLASTRPSPRRPVV